MRRVVASCNALKIWKFQHHLRDEVTFAQLCRSRCDALISAKGGSDVGCQLCDALGLIVEAAKLMLKDDATQARLARTQRGLLIIAEEKRRITKARAYDSLIARDHLIGLLTFYVRDRDK